MKGSARVRMDTMIRAAESQVSCDLAGEAVVLSLESGTYYGLNPVAARIWELVQEPRSVRELVDQLVQEYEVDADACATESVELIEQLAEWDLVILQNGSPGSSWRR